MAYKIIGTVLIFLIATPLYGQAEKGLEPIGVELLSHEPTTVITAEPFTVVYRVKYLDLSERGREIVFFSDEITTDYMQGQVGPEFKVIEVKLADRVDRGGEYWQDISVTLKIISEEKLSKKIPKTQFHWAENNIGQGPEELQGLLVEASEEAYLNYVTTTTDNPYLDIIEGLKLGDFSSQILFYRFYVPIGLFLFVPFWLLLMIRWLKSSKIVASLNDSDSDDVPVEDLRQYLAESEALTFGQARKALSRILKMILISSTTTGMAELNRDICKNLRAILMAAIPELDSGDTPQYILERIDGKDDWPMKKIYMDLAGNLIFLKDNICQDTISPNLAISKTKTEALILLVKKLKWHNRVLVAIFWNVKRLAYMLADPRRMIKMAKEFF